MATRSIQRKKQPVRGRSVSPLCSGNETERFRQDNSTDRRFQSPAENCQSSKPLGSQSPSTAYESNDYRSPSPENAHQQSSFRSHLPINAYRSRSPCDSLPYDSYSDENYIGQSLRTQLLITSIQPVSTTINKQLSQPW